MKPQKIPLFIIPFIFCYCFILTIFLFSDLYAQRIGQLVSRTTAPLVSVKHITISPFHGIRLRDVTFNTASHQIVKMDSITLKCSFLKLFQKEIVLKNILVDNTQTDFQYQQIKMLPGVIISQLAKMQSTKPSGGFRIDVSEVKTCFRKVTIHLPSRSNEGNERTLAFDLCINQSKNRTICEGSIDYNQSSIIRAFSKNREYRALWAHNRFIFDFEILGADFILNQLKLELGRYDAIGSGAVYSFMQDPLFDIRFHFSPIRLDEIHSLRSLNPSGGDIGLTGHLTGDLSNLSYKSEVIMPTLELQLEGEPLTLDHLYALINYNVKNGDLTIKELKGRIDDQTNLSVKGKIKNLLLPYWDIRCVLESVDNISTGSKEQKNLMIDLQGQFQERKFEGQINLTTGAGTQDKQYVAQLFNLALQDQNRYDDKDIIFVRIPKVRLIEKTITKTGPRVIQQLIFRDMDVFLNMVGKRTDIKEIRMIGYGGQIIVKGFIKFGREDVDYSIAAYLDQLQLNNIKVSAPVSCEISGNVSGKILLDNTRGAQVKGLIMANGFALSKLEPLDEVADFLGLQTIKEIAEADIAVNFEISPKTKIIRRFDFDSPTMAMRSSYDIDVKDWLEGDIALSVPRDVLGESRIFRKLLSIAREREDRLDFVMHLSGFLGALRIELVKSDFRDKLKERISVAVQKYIEKELSKAIEGQAQ